MGLFWNWIKWDWNEILWDNEKLINLVKVLLVCIFMKLVRMILVS